MDYKKITRQAYEKFSREFETNTIPLFENKKRDAKQFISNLKGKEYWTWEAGRESTHYISNKGD